MRLKNTVCWYSLAAKRRRPNRIIPVSNVGIVEASQPARESPGLSCVHRTCTAKAAVASIDSLR